MRRRAPAGARGDGGQRPEEGRLAGARDDEGRADGYAVELLRGELAARTEDAATARAAFEHAHALDPTQCEPLAALADIAAAEKVPEEEVRDLEKLAPLSEHSRRQCTSAYCACLLELGASPTPSRGEAAIWADMDGLNTHLLFAEALLATGDSERARFELESATLCRGEPAERPTRTRVWQSSCSGRAAGGSSESSSSARTSSIRITRARRS